jgi:hypothetical protein
VFAGFNAPALSACVMNEATAEPPERTVYLVMLGGAPAIWMFHFLLSYATVAIWCGRVVGVAGPLGAARTAIAWYTVVALLGIALIGWSGYKRHGHGTETLPEDSDTPRARHRFLGFATLLLAGLSAMATVYVAASAMIMETCR